MKEFEFSMKKNNEPNPLFPVFLKLHQLKTLVVGAGTVGLEKLTALLSNSPLAAVTVVAPRIKEELRNLAGQYPHCTLIEREFREEDLEEKHFVICATDNHELHKVIKQLAARKNIIVNVADTPELCDCYLGSIVQKGSIKIAISTNGKSPTIAKRLKEIFSDLLPDEMEELLDNMQKIRNSIKGDFEEKVKQLNAITRDFSSKKAEKV